MNLTLLAPVGLIAAISLGIVLLLHIRRQTPPPRSFPSLRFWTPGETAESERQRFRRPPLTWPLILQLLVAALVTLALARPAVSGAWAGFAGRTTPEHLIVMLDGSTSMLAHNDGELRTRFEHGRQLTLSMLSDWQSGDVATVMVLGTSVETRSASNRQQLGEVESWLRNLQLPGGRANLNNALRLARNLALPDRTNRIELVTDEALAVDPDIATSVPMPVHLQNVGQQAVSNNVAITGIVAQPLAGYQNQYGVTVTLSNFSEAEADVPWSVEADGTEVARNTAFMPPGVSQQVTVNLPVGALQTRASIDFPDALYDDNSAQLPLQADRFGQLDILMISDAPSRLLRALQVLPGAHVDLQPTSITGIRDFSRSYDLTVIEGGSLLPDDLPVTPMLLVQPQSFSDRFSISGTLAAPQISSVDTNDPILAGVDLSGVTFGETPAYSLGTSEKALVTGSGNGTSAPLIWSGEVNGQPYVSFAFSVADSNIGQRVAFPILVASTVNSLTTSPIPASIPIGNSVSFTPEPDVAKIDVILPDESHRTVDVQADASQPDAPALPVVIDFTGNAGMYTVRSLRADGSLLDEGSFVVNAGHPQESNLAVNRELSSILDLAGGDTAAATSSLTHPNQLWWLLALLAFIVLLAEWFVSGHVRTRRTLVLKGIGT